MNRFVWDEGNVVSSEQEITRQKGILIYDGEEKTLFENGELVLTSHRFLFKCAQQKDLSLHLSLVVYVEKESGGWTRSGKIVVHVNAPSQGDKASGPVKFSPFNYIKFSFRQGGENEFFQHLSETMEKREWEKVPLVGIAGKQYRAGIVGIERQIQARQAAADKNISEAFKDLKKLMDMAKDMVTVSKNIAQKITEKKGCISDDETVQFKSYLLSLGISDPVTRSTHGADAYHTELAKELAQVLEKPLKEAGGILSLSDVYCRVNRARGLELISPEDLINACSLFLSLNLPMKLHTFDSGVMVVQANSHDQQTDNLKLKDLLTEKNSSLSADELSRILNTTVILAREKLLQAEKDGTVCRDDSIEGLRFYPNLFLTVED